MVQPEVQWRKESGVKQGLCLHAAKPHSDASIMLSKTKQRTFCCCAPFGWDSVFEVKSIRWANQRSVFLTRLDVNFTSLKENDAFINKLKHDRQCLSFCGRLLVSAWSATASFSVSTWWEYMKAAYIHGKNVQRLHTDVARMHKSSVCKRQAIWTDFCRGKTYFSYPVFWTTHHSRKGGIFPPAHSLLYPPWVQDFFYVQHPPLKCNVQMFCAVE